SPKPGLRANYGLGVEAKELSILASECTIIGLQRETGLWSRRLQFEHRLFSFQDSPSLSGSKLGPKDHLRRGLALQDRPQTSGCKIQRFLEEKPQSANRIDSIRFKLNRPSSRFELPGFDRGNHKVF